LRVKAVSQSNCGKGCSFVAEVSLVFAQLRDMLAAKDSSIVPQENQHGGLLRPQRAKTNLLPITIWNDDLCEAAAE
jgi:hypothetical protein